MYFWRIDKLKAELRTGELPQLEQFRYLLAESVLYAIATIPFFPANSFDILNSGLLVIIVAIGTYYIYRCNNGDKGKRLVEICISLGWVMSIRFLILILIPTIFAFTLAYSVFHEIPEETTLADVILTNSLVVFFYYLLGKHVREVARDVTQ